MIDIFKRRCINVLSVVNRISQIQQLPHDKAMVNVHGYAYLLHMYIAWASALLIFGSMAMREPDLRDKRRSDSCAFLCVFDYEFIFLRRESAGTTNI